jgi:hypothetical protein
VSKTQRSMTNQTKAVKDAKFTDWPATQRPIVVMSRPGTRNDPAYFTPDEARRLAEALVKAAEAAES